MIDIFSRSDAEGVAKIVTLSPPRFLTGKFS